MAVGAIYGGVSSAIEQNKETGHINIDKVIGDTLGGAVIAGAPFIALIAAPEVLATAGYGAWSAGQAINSTGVMNIGIKAFTASNSVNAFLYGPLLPKLIIDPKKMPNIAKNIENAQSNGALRISVKSHS